MNAAKRRAHDRARGITARVDATASRDHVAYLLKQGLTLPTIAKTAGTSRQVLSNVLDGQATIYRETAAAILAIAPPRVRQHPRHNGWISAEGPRRRIRALMALGWTAADIAAASGRPDTTCQVQQIASVRQWVRPATYHRIDRAYDALGMKPGPSDLNRHRARLAGWPPPLAWDDIDDPDETPKVAVDPDRQTVHDEDIDWLLEQGLTVDEAAAQLGIHLHSLQDRLRRHRKAA